jgi:RNA polymerase sigma-70 factor, ECF subfamily
VEDWSGLAASLGGDAEAAEVLREAYEAGRVRWPEIQPLPTADWGSQIALHRPPDVDLAIYARSLVAVDLYLACGCVLALPAALAAFDAEYLGRIAAYVATIDGTPQFADEVRQILRERLLVGRNDARPRLAGYTGRGALASWLRVTAVRVALDLRADPAIARRGDDAAILDELGSDGSPELELLRHRHVAVFEDAVRRALRALPSAERVLLRMYFASGQNTSHIAAAFRIDRSTAARRLVAARQAVFDATKRFVQEQILVETSEFASLARALHDQLNLSLATLLAEPAPSTPA